MINPQTQKHHECRYQWAYKQTIMLGEMTIFPLSKRSCSMWLHEKEITEFFASSLTLSEQFLNMQNAALQELWSHTLLLWKVIPKKAEDHKFKYQGYTAHIGGLENYEHLNRCYFPCYYHICASNKYAPQRPHVHITWCTLKGKVCHYIC